MGVKNPRQMLAAGMGGVVATAVDVSCLVLMVESGVPVPVAAFMASCVGAAVNFVVNKYIAFRDLTPVSLKQLTRFGAVAVATALWMALAMQVVAVELGVPVVIAKLVCAVLVFVAWTYPAQRRLVFAPRTSPTWNVDVDADADVSAA